MAGETNKSGVKPRGFYPPHAKENATMKSEVTRKKRWADNFIRDNMLYYRRMLKLYFIFIFFFIAIVVLAYNIKYL